jgi:hypothetical protein
MAECLGLCDYVDDVCMGCGRDFSLIEPEKDEAACSSSERNAASSQNKQVKD